MVLGQEVSKWAGFPTVAAAAAVLLQFCFWSPALPSKPWNEAENLQLQHTLLISLKVLCREDLIGS